MPGVIKVNDTEYKLFSEFIADPEASASVGERFFESVGGNVPGELTKEVPLHALGDKTVGVIDVEILAKFTRGLDKIDLRLFFEGVVLGLIRKPGEIAAYAKGSKSNIQKLLFDGFCANKQYECAERVIQVANPEIEGRFRREIFDAYLVSRQWLKATKLIDKISKNTQRKSFLNLFWEALHADIDRLTMKSQSVDLVIEYIGILHEVMETFPEETSKAKQAKACLKKRQEALVKC